MNIPDYYGDVSLRLTQVLDASGLREDLRWRRINTWLQIEELERIWYEILDGPDARLYFFGSQTEATTIPGLSPDIDKVYVPHGYVVLQDLQFWDPCLEAETTLFMVADESTPPGYVKLQVVQRDAQMTVRNYQDETLVLDSDGRSVLSSGLFIESLRNQFSKLYKTCDRHGPALTISTTGIFFDFVFAVLSPCWPDQVSRRMSTSGNYNWPTRPMMDVMKQTALLFVPVGHKLSPEQHLEWRMSFSLAEKLLMMQFNSTQYKCYAMLKLIKNTFINVDTVENVLTSYHCKTCMFYLIADTPGSLWHPNNLMLCIDLCLRQLLSWVQCAKCPNYFTPDENMFIGKLGGSAQGKIASTLENLLRQNGRYIIKIPYQNIGENVIRVCQSIRMELDCPDENIFHQTISHLSNTLQFFCFCSVNYHLPKVSFFRSRYGPRHEIFNTARSIFCSALGTHLASQSLKQETYNQEALIAAHELLLYGISSDVAAGKLKLAAFYLAQGKLDSMEDVLNQVDANFTHIVSEQGYILPQDNTLSTIVHENLSTVNFIQNCLAFVVFYSLSDIYSIPKVLIFEIFRSMESKQNVISFSLKRAAVTAKIYLYFLQHHCFHLQGKVTHRLVALNKIIWVSRDYYQKLHDIMENTTITLQRNMSAFLGHFTTSLNLISYCLKQERRLMDAFKVIRLSIKIKNQHNAAMWQIATFISSFMRIVRSRQ
ncbi:hypothetical protein CHS0354_006766 [Potamilus streckersoni]|uniref:Mab-21-like HhH/H2TH-like domain-containing protein n=1 Tax=Potamilus streckersoni TaxID=2493646 RepID=A0AAE0S8E2_9BIVA|nr:hypothetical protein CHS0354_006766 [Potamilus streckersoni]